MIVFRDDAPLRRPLVAESIYNRVKKLIADLRFNDSGKSMIISSTAYIKDPFATVEGLASLVLAPDLKALLSSLFGDEPILTSCAIQNILILKELSLTMIPIKGLVLFIILMTAITQVELLFFIKVAI